MEAKGVETPGAAATSGNLLLTHERTGKSRQTREVTRSCGWQTLKRETATDFAAGIISNDDIYCLVAPGNDAHMRHKAQLSQGENRDEASFEAINYQRCGRTGDRDRLKRTHSGRPSSGSGGRSGSFGFALPFEGAALAQTGSAPQMSEKSFKNVKVMKDIPVDEFMGEMGLFSAALSYCCGDCHVGAGTDNPDWASDKSHGR